MCICSAFRLDANGDRDGADVAFQAFIFKTKTVFSAFFPRYSCFVMTFSLVLEINDVLIEADSVYLNQKIMFLKK